MFNIKIFKETLASQVSRRELSETTMEGYIRCLNQLDIKCRDKDGPAAENIEKAIGQLCKNTQQAAKYISAVKKYERDVLHNPQLLLYGEPLMRLRKGQGRPAGGKKLSNSERTYSHKINAIRNKPIKLALRLQKKSGLRVSEIVALRKSDVRLDEALRKIELRVRQGKGGKPRTVSVLEDEYLYEQLKEALGELAPEQHVFQLTAAALKKKAGSLGMETHDLRRINARQRFRRSVATGCSRRAARAETGRQLGHDNLKVTNIYLGDEWEGTVNHEQSQT